MGTDSGFSWPVEVSGTHWAASGVSGDLEVVLSIPFVVTFDRLGRSGEVFCQWREGRVRVTFKMGQKDFQGAVRGSVPPWSLRNQGANPHREVSGHKTEKKVTGSSQHGLTKFAKDKPGLINLIALQDKKIWSEEEGRSVGSWSTTVCWENQELRPALNVEQFRIQWFTSHLVWLVSFYAY